MVEGFNLVEEMKNGYLTFEKLFKVAAEVFKAKFLYIFYTFFLTYGPMYLAISLGAENVIKNYIRMPYVEGFSVEYIDLLNDSIAVTIVSLVFTLIFTNLHSSALTYISKCHIEGKPVKALGILDATLGIWGKIIFTSILFYLIMVCGMLLLIIPGILVSFYFNYHVSVTTVTGKWGFAALEESARTIKGKAISTLGLYMVTFVIGFCLQFVVSLGFSLIGASGGGDFLKDIVSGIINSFTLTITIIWFLNLYYNKNKPASIENKGENKQDLTQQGE